MRDGLASAHSRITMFSAVSTVKWIGPSCRYNNKRRTVEEGRGATPSEIKRNDSCSKSARASEHCALELIYVRGSVRNTEEKTWKCTKILTVIDKQLIHGSRCGKFFHDDWSNSKFIDSCQLISRYFSFVNKSFFPFRWCLIWHFHDSIYMSIY